MDAYLSVKFVGAVMSIKRTIGAGKCSAKHTVRCLLLT